MHKSNKSKKKIPDCLDDKIDGLAVSATASRIMQKQFFEKLRHTIQAKNTIRRADPILRLLNREIALLEVMDRGPDIFISKEKFYRWLTTPSIALGGKIPLKLIISKKEKLVWDELMRIEHGIFA